MARRNFITYCGLTFLGASTGFGPFTGDFGLLQEVSGDQFWQKLKGVDGRGALIGAARIDPLLSYASDYEITGQSPATVLVNGIADLLASYIQNDYLGAPSEDIWEEIEQRIDYTYVSKAWTVVVPGGTPSPATGKTDLVVGSWNTKWFGYYDEDRHDYDCIAALIEKFDVVAIQELRGENYRERLDKLIATLSSRGYSYTYTVSQETGYMDNPGKADATAPKKDYLERYAFMWDTDRVNLVSPSTPHAFVGSPRINNATYRQVPIYADFKVSNGNGFDFRILTIHTVYNEKINAVRRAEIQAVHDWIIDQTTNPANTEKNIVAMGDFNANPKGQPHHFDAIIKGTTNYRVLMNEPVAAGVSSLRTTVQQSDNPGTDYFLLPVYDHILVSNQTIYALPNNHVTRAAQDLGVVEFDQETHWQQQNSWNDVIRAMSDHRPMWFKMAYDASDLD